MSPTLPTRVRTAAALVTERSRHVRLVPDRIAPYARTLPREELTVPAPTPGDPPVDDPIGIITWTLVINAINFGSGFFPVLRKLPGLSGSKTVFAHVARRFASAGPFTTGELREIDEEDVARLLEQDPNGPARELLGWFTAAWRSLGSALEDRWDGDVTGIVEEADGSASALAELLAGIDGWSDVSTHGDLEVPLFKRAQIVPAHLSLAFGRHGPGRFDDLDELTIFADNLVPHVLRLDGVLSFEPDLVERIDRDELLPPGSPEEVEIRAVAVHAAELIVSELRRTGRASAMALDQLLWRRGAGRRYKVRPRHRARTTAY